MSKRKNLQKELVEKALGRGTEPSWELGKLPTKMELNKVLNYYNANHDEKDKRKWAAAWLKKNRPELVKAHEEAPLWQNGTGAVLMRLESRGLTLHEAHRAVMIKWAEGLVKPVVEEEEEGPKRKARGPKENPISRALDDILDEAVSKPSSEPRFDIDPKADPTPAIAYCKRELAAIREEPGLYPKHMKRWFELAVTRLEGVAVAVKTRKVVTRKVRKVDPVKATKGVKFLKELPELKLVGQKPSDMVGKKKAYLYHSKWKMLIKVSANDAGFAFKGQAVDNLDLTKVVGKKMRKPEETFKEGTGIRALDRAFGLIKTKETKLDKVRFNEGMVILNLS